MPPKKKAKYNKEYSDNFISSILDSDGEVLSDSDDGEGHLNLGSGESKKVSEDVDTSGATSATESSQDEALQSFVDEELPKLISEIIPKLSPLEKKQYAEILNRNLIKSPYNLYQYLEQVRRNGSLLAAIQNVYFFKGEEAMDRKNEIYKILRKTQGGFLPSPTAALNAINPFNQTYINKLEILNLNAFLSMIGSPTQLPGKIKSGVQQMLSANYLAMGKAIIDVFVENEELLEKSKELGFELYGVVGDGALFITEKHDEQLKTIIEKSSYIGNFLMIPSKTLGIVVFNILMGVAGTVPGVAAGYRVLKLGKKFVEVSGKTLELLLRIGTGNWEEFNNFLQLLMEAAVMIPKGLYKFFTIFKLGRDVVMLLANSGASAASALMSAANSNESVGFGELTSNIGLPGMGNSNEDGEEEDMGMGSDEGPEFIGDDKQKKKQSNKLTKKNMKNKNMKNMKNIKNKKKTKKRKKKRRK
jgi:hypothetical protein